MSVVYLIGGCSRSGKSTLARRLLHELSIPQLSTDVLDASFRDLGEIALADDGGQQSNQVVQRLLEPMVFRTYAGHAPYVFEGIHVSPEFIKKMVDRHGHGVRACVLGYPNTTIARKLDCIEAASSETGDWLFHRSTEEQTSYLRRQRGISLQMQAECRKHGVSFVDTGADYETGLERAFAVLTCASSP